MKKIVLTLLIIALIAAVGVIVFFAVYKKQTQVCLKDNCFNVEIASNEASRKLGLMFRKKMDKRHGMLFVFPNSGNYPFWMKNTYIPLDIIWIDQNYKVVFIQKNAQPCGNGICQPIDPKKNAKYVLEINAGITDKINLNIGDTVELKK